MSLQEMIETLVQANILLAVLQAMLSKVLKFLGDVCCADLSVVRGIAKALWINGTITAYKNCDNIWYFYLQNKV